MPSAPIPNVPLATESVDPGLSTIDGPCPPDAGRVFCVSDLHTDHQANLEWCRALADSDEFKRDVLIVAGDVTSSLVLLEETLTLLVCAFAHVFFVPGNVRESCATADVARRTSPHCVPGLAA